MKSQHMSFNTIFTYVYHTYAQTFCHNIYKNSSQSQKMTIWPHSSTKETGWGHIGETETALCEILLYTLSMHRRTVIIKCTKKRLRYSHASLFNLLPLDILADIDIWLFGFEHWDKFKHVISRFKSMSNPILFAILHKLRTPYHNFRVFRLYIQVKYNWSHRHLMARNNGIWTHYEYFINISEYTT